MLTPEDVLNRYFGLSHFRDGQLDVIQAVMSGRDALVVLPTGGGKSLCYQIPAMLGDTGVVLVISPLIALMQEQVAFLKERGIAAVTINSTLDELEAYRSLSHAVTGKVALVYLSPEKVLSPHFMQHLAKIPVKLIAVDESHCISKWGHDFRPEYSKLNLIRTKLNTFGKNPPILALTATATDAVIRDIYKSLNLKDPYLFRLSPFRSNLHYEIRYPQTEEERYHQLVEYLLNFKNSKQKGKIIVYCATRKTVDDIYKKLKVNNFPVVKYHAGVSDVKREAARVHYAEGKKNILIATSAFGMGMDQPDVRYVIHYNPPSSVEAYTQEAGRAGRDGLISKCVLFYRPVDSFVMEKLSGSKHKHLLDAMMQYINSNECRQVYLNHIFNDHVEPCGVCDICVKKNINEKSKYFLNQKEKHEHKKRLSSITLTDEEQKILMEILYELPGVFGKTTIALTLKGAKTATIKKSHLDCTPQYGKLSHLPIESISACIVKKIEEGAVVVTGKKYPLIAPAGVAVSKKRSRKIDHAKKESSANHLNQNKEIPAEKKTNPNDLLRELKNWRDRTARKNRWKKFMVLQNKILTLIADAKPRTHYDLTLIQGLGDTRIEKYGDEILQIVKNHFIKNKI